MVKLGRLALTNPGTQAWKTILNPNLVEQAGFLIPNLRILIKGAAFYLLIQALNRAPKRSPSSLIDFIDDATQRLTKVCSNRVGDLNSVDGHLRRKWFFSNLLSNFKPWNYFMMTNGTIDNFLFFGGDRSPKSFRWTNLTESSVRVLCGAWI